MLNPLGFADIDKIELAVGRVRPLADKGLLDPPLTRARLACEYPFTHAAADFEEVES
jgi:hypothetical protein